ncbi:MmgE/PrpD family protein [Pusillimonas sp.]|uniref:MmgE/PrpD family protein n=1 Tax=Pusillimonas sp. TaxID=3040095 RepID=UPI0037C8CCAD
MATNNITYTLADWAVSLKGADIPQPTRYEGTRSLVNWIGCAIGGSQHDAVMRALAAVTQFSGPRQATVLGRPEMLDELYSALLNGISSHVLDYDDTHLQTIIHPAGPVAAALIPFAETRNISGSDLLTAFIVGMEVECRIGNCVYPDHYDRGWHITATAGVFGAAAAVGRLLGLNPREMSWAFGLAATQSSGLREMFGTMTKSFHPGRAAQSGMLAAILAKAGFDSSERAIEAPRGFANVMSTKQDYSRIVDGLGIEWEAATNTYKPFACGIVLHPAIDACSQIREDLNNKPLAVQKIELRVNPLVLELTGIRNPTTGLEGKFSVYHAVAYALIYGGGSPEAFTDKAVNDPSVVALRDRVTASVDPAIHEASVKVLVHLENGGVVKKDIEHAIGSLERPLSDEQINDKFLRQSSEILGQNRAEEALKLAWAVEELDAAGKMIAQACSPIRDVATM